MKKCFLNSIRISIKKQYPTYSEDKLDEIMYGIEGIYLTVTKTIIIFLIAILLGVTKELLFLLLAFNFIRLFAFGMHADNSLTCLLFSSSLFLGAALLCKYIILSKVLLYILNLISLVLISIYAPADTVKRPLIKKKKRIKFKILSIVVSVVYIFGIITIKNNYIINYLTFGLLIEAILVNPITYRLFGMPYNNYKNYNLTT